MAEIKKFICEICGNDDFRFLGFRAGKFFCRRCISFKGQEATGKYIKNDNGNYVLSYTLTSELESLSSELVNNYKKGLDSLVHAVCGSPKARNP